MSIYFGLSARLQLLSVSFSTIAIQNNSFEYCSVTVRIQSGNVYGGAVSLYMGGYASDFALNGDAVAAVGDTVVSNVSVTLDTARYQSCSAKMMSPTFGSFGANVYGGSFSFYIGGYAWSRSVYRNSNSMCGATTVSGVNVYVLNSSSIDSEASTTIGLQVSGQSFGANAYGGSLSVLHIGAYAWSFSSNVSSSSSSVCGHTSAVEMSVHANVVSCSNCVVSSSAYGSSSRGANTFGGFMSVLFIGAYAWSCSNLASSSSSSSISGTTYAMKISVHVIDSTCSSCHALSTTIQGASRGANTYGGAMSVMYIGAYSWSFSIGTLSSSICGATAAAEVSVVVKDAACYNCSAVTSSLFSSFGANSYGGSMSFLYVGAYAWSSSNGAFSSSKGSCGATTAADITVSASNVSCSFCAALTTTGSESDSSGANSYGGSISAVYIGGYCYSFSVGGVRVFSGSSVEATLVSRLVVSISDTVIDETMAQSGERSFKPCRCS